MINILAKLRKKYRLRAESRMLFDEAESFSFLLESFWHRYRKEEGISLKQSGKSKRNKEVKERVKT